MKSAYPTRSANELVQLARRTQMWGVGIKIASGGQRAGVNAAGRGPSIRGCQGPAPPVCATSSYRLQLKQGLFNAFESNVVEQEKGITQLQLTHILPLSSITT